MNIRSAVSPFLPLLARAWFNTAFAQTTTQSYRTLSILALGDSYIAGNGARGKDGQRNYKEGSCFGADSRGCFRSDSSWVGWYRECLQGSGSDLVASSSDAIMAVQFINRACSGATIGSTQLEAVTENTDLVFLSVSGNDLGFLDIVQRCYYTPAMNASPSDGTDSCSVALEALSANSFQAVHALKPIMTELLVNIYQGGYSDMKVVLVGYPYMSLLPDFWIFEDNGSASGVETYNAGRRIREIGDQVDIMQQQAINDANDLVSQQFAQFVNVKGLFSGHEVDPEIQSTNPNGWIHEFQPLGTEIYPEEAYHYNPLGHQELGKYLCETYNDFGAGRDIEADQGGDSVDLVFVIDTTGSMLDSIASARFSATGILTNLASRTQSLRMGLVEYRDHVDSGFVARIAQDFTTSIGLLQTALNGLSVDGGDDIPEAIWSGLMLAFSLDWRDGVKKLIIQIGDAPALNPERVTGYTAQDVIDASLTIDPVIVSAIDNGNAGWAVREVVAGTGGEILTGSPSEVAADIEIILDSTLAAPFAWVGTGYVGTFDSVILFDGSGSYARAGLLLQFEWDVDQDGVFDFTTSSPYLEYMYGTGFVGLVTLRVTDSNGLSALATACVDVSIDGDAIPDEEDNCPLVYNIRQQDHDDNGVGNECDDGFVAEPQAPYVYIDEHNIEGISRNSIPIQGNVFDANDDVVAISWNVENDSGGLCTFQDPLSLSTAVTCASSGNFLLTLEAVDSTGLVGFDAAHLNVTQAGSETPSSAPTSVPTSSPTVTPVAPFSDSPTSVPTSSPTATSLAPFSDSPTSVPTSSPTVTSVAPFSDPPTSPLSSETFGCERYFDYYKKAIWRVPENATIA